MPALNRVELIGNLGDDPQLSYTPTGKAVCGMRVATTEEWQPKRGGPKKRITEWHRVSAWNELGEHCAKYLKKGAPVYIDGKIKTRTYDKDGQRHYLTEVIAFNVQFLAKQTEHAIEGEAVTDVLDADVDF